MHGRIKVRTTEEEKARKEKERQEKLKVFKHAMQKILYKRKQGEQDDEQLEITGKVLSSNPDIYTLWNIRREILILFSKTKNEEEMSKIYDTELNLTEYCLKINPKSYCSWHQREWVLTSRPNPDWKKELELCNTYLKYDERNFHTWDYRRFVVSQFKPPLQEEFDFTTEKLYDNFSNYSAWHYRSKMLVELYPDVKGGRPIQDNHHKHELKMVQSAAFTDPDDTSAWFYQRWLLGAVKVTIQLVSYTVTPLKTTLAWSRKVSNNYINSNVNIYFNNQLVEGKWIPCTGLEYDDLWIFEHNQEVSDNMDIKVEHGVGDEKQIINSEKYQPCTYVGKNKIFFKNQYSQPVIEELNEQLDSCRQLLALEPDNKWTLLTTTFFLYCIDANLYHKEIMVNLETLKDLDSQRAGYYSDLISKWSIEQQLPQDYNSNSLEYKISFSQKITSLPHLNYYSYCQVVDLSNQALTSRILPTLTKLQHCKVLNLSSNKINTLDGFPDIDLEELHLEDNIELDKMEVEVFKHKHKFMKIYF
ncbi:geranylgeranyl transferase type-2 subunit alpha [Bicyclus anynana]|uniref:Geranylgeranyl transferase type-2 subunit alpha n=1 Tax=Bicyclus anynana TaxID=110368 RepID=A0A6J1MU12_BICAN|nr:geranylgeranyl transferase type-2 subunit alpha [Bicyclus anynana]